MSTAARETGEGSALSAVSARRALEALRAGVPNRDAVSALGSQQTAVADRFARLLDAIGTREAAEPIPGMLLAGGFGSGKSHVLEHLAHTALDAGFVVSKVVISKETALHDPAKVFAAAIADAVGPASPGRRSTRSPPGCFRIRRHTPGCTAGCTPTMLPSTAGSRRACSSTSMRVATPSSPTASCASGPATRFRSPTCVAG